MSQTSYGQYCPIAVPMDLLGGRWTFLIIRELADGSKRFNDIHRVVPLMSRTLLTTRLRALEEREYRHAVAQGGIRVVGGRRRPWQCRQVGRQVGPGVTGYGSFTRRNRR